MKKAPRPPPKSPMQFEQVPVVMVKKIVGVTAVSTSDQSKPPIDAKFIVPPAVKGAKRGL